MYKVFRFLSGAMLGFFLGGVAGLLLAPTAGKDLREKVDNYVIESTNEIRLAAQQKRTELENQLSNLRQPKSE
jgi:gas vesicle protein